VALDLDRARPIQPAQALALVIRCDASGFLNCAIRGALPHEQVRNLSRIVQHPGHGLCGQQRDLFAVHSAPEKAAATPVSRVSSGIGGFDIIEREHIKLMQGGPGKISPFFIPSAIVNLASGHISIRYGARAEFGDGDGVLGFRTFDRRFVQDYRARCGGDDDLRRNRSGYHADGDWGICVDEGAFDAQ